jgi:hypothetical protein
MDRTPAQHQEKMSFWRTFLYLEAQAMQREKKDSKEVKIHETYSLLGREERFKPEKTTEKNVGLL